MKVYGDAVVFVQKQPDGSLRRSNAIVLASSLHSPTGPDRKPLKDADGVVLPKEEHLDLAFAVLSLAPEGQVLKTRNMDEIFRPAYDVRPAVDGAWVGWEEMPQPAWMQSRGTAQGSCSGSSGTEKYTAAKGDYAQSGDPYGIEKEYTAQSAAVDVQGNSETPVRSLPTQEETDAVVAQAKAESAERRFETKTYSDGSTATGAAPLPDLSPAQQDAAGLPTAGDLDAVAAEDKAKEDTGA